MGKIILICGKICSGKSHYVKQLKESINAVVFSCDEITARLRQYFYKKSEEVIRSGGNVILDLEKN